MNPLIKGYSEVVKDGVRIVTVDMNRAEYRGMKWTTLGDFGKRKFENLIVLEKPKDQTKVRYV